MVEYGADRVRCRDHAERQTFQRGPWSVWARIQRVRTLTDKDANGRERHQVQIDVGNRRDRKFHRISRDKKQAAAVG